MATGAFLCPANDGGDPEWIPSLRNAGGGVCFDLEAVDQLITDHCDFDDRPQVVDLDRLGTSLDYR